MRRWRRNYHVGYETANTVYEIKPAHVGAFRELLRYVDAELRKTCEQQYKGLLSVIDGKKLAVYINGFFNGGVPFVQLCYCKVVGTRAIVSRKMFRSPIALRPGDMCALNWSKIMHHVYYPEYQKIVKERIAASSPALGAILNQAFGEKRGPGVTVAQALSQIFLAEEGNECLILGWHEDVWCAWYTYGKRTFIFFF
jgi:hypothetical protein